MSSTAMVHVRVDEKVKERATATLAEMGLSLSDAVRMMLVRVAAEKALPSKYACPMRPPSKRCSLPIDEKANGSVPPRRCLRTWASSDAGDRSHRSI